MLFKRERHQHKTQGRNSHKDPLQHLDPSDEELYPKTLKMVNYLNQKPRSYIIDLHLISDLNNPEAKSLFVHGNLKTGKFLPAFYISFCLNGKIEDYALSIRLFRPNKKVILLLNAPIAMLPELTPSYHDNQNNFISFQFTPKEEIKATPGAWVCLAQLQKIIKWDNQSYEAKIIAEKEFEFPIIKEEK